MNTAYPGTRPDSGGFMVKPAYPGTRPDSGGFMVKLIVILAVVGVAMTLVSRIGTTLYDYYLMRDLANRVVKDYAKLPVEEVKRRIDYEMNRSRLPADAFTLTRTPRGYRVRVEMSIPLGLAYGDEEFAVPGYEEWNLTYQSES
ncbi:MAG: hypothetical protein HQL99_02685 [Magnetococcales bacterium]|nr:hypothetical protein [Magnetococcales bacterium]